MLSSVSGFINRRRRGLTVLASLAGGAYLLTSYARQRFADLTERLTIDRAAKENLRRRFQQNQEDCAFTLLALLPTLAKQVLDELDVEALTAELQRRAEETRREKLQAADLPTPVAAEQQEPELEEPQHPQLADTEGSTVLVGAPDAAQEHTSSGTKPNGTASHAELPSAEAGQVEGGEPSLGGGAAGEDPSSAQLREAADPTYASKSEPERQELRDPRSKAELWQAVKLLTFHRTVTSLYLLALLSLQTHIQLNLLGRHNYISSVHEQASPPQNTLESLLSSLDDEKLADSILRGDTAGEDAGIAGKTIDAATERQYLTFSWWFLQKGWKEISKRTEGATAEALESISLKSQLGSEELSRLLLDVRRRVEYEPTGAIYSFAPAIFPMRGQDVTETLEQSGLADTEVRPALRSLLDETRDFVDSPDFAIVLRSCLDRLFAMLVSSLGHLFVDESASLPPLPASASGLGQHRFSEVQEKKVKLAAILPALARCSHTVFNGLPNEYAEALAENRELQEFSAVVYSNFILAQ